MCRLHPPSADQFNPRWSHETYCEEGGTRLLNCPRNLPKSYFKQFEGFPGMFLIVPEMGKISETCKCKGYCEHCRN